MDTYGKGVKEGGVRKNEKIYIKLFDNLLTLLFWMC